MGAGGEVANAQVCKTCIRGFDSRPALQLSKRHTAIYTCPATEDCEIPRLSRCKLIRPQRRSKDLAAKKGIFAGISSGATFVGALHVAASAPQGSTLLCMLPDARERYFSTPLFVDVSSDITPEEVEIAHSTPVSCPENSFHNFSCHSERMGPQTSPGTPKSDLCSLGWRLGVGSEESAFVLCSYLSRTTGTPH
jgi:hypothetical protein